jgi:biopolymer transport protein ExbD
MLRARRRRRPDSATADLTPMIDVTFQLLIFFILCTRFRVPEFSHEAELPQNEGMASKAAVPLEKLTIYCQWDEAAGGNSYVLALDARAREPVANSFATLRELLADPARYKQVHTAVTDALRDRQARTKTETIEISFAKDATRGAESGTVPWLFVTLAIDAVAELNKERALSKQSPLQVQFKFADGLRVHR